jgi:hypothetical protein
VYFVKRAIKPEPPLDLAEELVAQCGTEEEAAAAVFRTWPTAAVAPYTVKDKKSRFFRKRSDQCVLLIWENHEQAKASAPPVGFISEHLMGFHFDAWAAHMCKPAESEAQP